MKKFFNHPLTLIALILILGFELLLFYRPFNFPSLSDIISAVIPNTVVRLTNEERAAVEVGELRVSEALERAAQLKAEDMAKRGYFSHYSPEGLEPWIWLDQVGYRYRAAGENLAINYFSSESVARAWMRSEAHRENILRADFSETGVGMASGRYKGRAAVFIVQFFATPAP